MNLRGVDTATEPPDRSRVVPIVAPGSIKSNVSAILHRQPFTAPRLRQP
jgi:hypothetical protein